jgi:ATP-dependent DNA helicase RecG
VIAECERYGIAPPVFEERQGFIIVTFKVPVAEGAGAEKSKEKGREKGREKSPEKILRLIASSPKITTLEIAEAIGLSRAGVEKAIKKLKQEGRLSRIGPDKGGEWEVIR